MKAFYHLLLLAVFISVFSSCKKDPAAYSDFSVITETGIACDTIGVPDPFDWTYDNSWTPVEQSFLKFKDSIPSGDSFPGLIQVWPACPNPNNGVFTVNVYTEKVCKMRVVCVNNELQVLYYNARQCPGNSTSAGYSFDFTGLTAFHKGEYYRLYYGFYTAKDSLYYQGHGDFRIE